MEGMEGEQSRDIYPLLLLAMFAITLEPLKGKY